MVQSSSAFEGTPFFCEYLMTDHSLFLAIKNARLAAGFSQKIPWDGKLAFTL